MTSMASNIRSRPLGGLGPVAADHVLVERLAGADAEPVPAGVHRLEGRAGLRDHRGVEPERRAGDAGAEVAGGALADGGQHVPHERRLALRGHPRLEVVGGHAAGEAVLLGERRQLDRLARMELLEHRRVAHGQVSHAVERSEAGSRRCASPSSPTSTATCPPWRRCWPSPTSPLPTGWCCSVTSRSGRCPAESLDLLASLGERAVWVHGNCEREIVAAYDGQRGARSERRVRARPPHRCCSRGTARSWSGCR